MGSLHIIFDPVTKRLSGSFGAKYLSGIGSVVLNRDGAQVLDVEGRDLLVELGEGAGPAPTRSSMEQDVAACFGLDGATTASAPEDTGEVRGFADWNVARGSL